MVNLHAHEPAEISVTLSAGDFGELGGRVLTGSTIDAHNTFATADAVAPTPFDDFRRDNRKLHVYLPARSVAMLEINLT
jgi:alpha-N-arabinofuranosidase